MTENEAPGMDVHIEVTLDERPAVSRGDVLARWFRGAVDSFFPDPSAYAEAHVLVDHSFERGGEKFRTKGFEESWPSLEERLRRYPFYASVNFFVPVDHPYETVGSFGRVTASYLRSDGSYAALAVGLQAAERTADPRLCARIWDFLATALDGSDPAFARVEHRDFHDTTHLEAALRRPRRKSLRESRTYLRGYSWVTGVPGEVAARLGGASRLAATGAFHAVRELRGGGLLLQATETLAGYDDRAMREVFRALAPVLPPGIPQDDPAREHLRVVFEDASGV
ncbi:hypothetical protein [Streptomyces chromofuscus]|uniref:Uncharacterized protein n=1 Tax=Streptomyces chromofuscus TaxID=42881 RepID=A0A7M2TDN1_STRCW|nr:hypothetical protein [Streptomyces chromofuscus]QOV46820.1 hypothetical protein IPT68_13575 [Streptomyces chromofuscus]GGT13770.1 hypothetical protein GCM10010254_37860 [Streptomyces chromofuscus]